MATATAAPKWRAILEPTPLAGPTNMPACTAMALVARAMTDASKFPIPQIPTVSAINNWIQNEVVPRCIDFGCNVTGSTATSVSIAAEGHTITIAVTQV
jgi:hypothetical protein